MTAKKKHLIELMIEASVKWPVGAEYAAQDKKDNKVQFYKNGKPNPCRGFDEWMGDNCTFLNDKGITLPSLCHTWNKTIVTREQYAEAVAAADNGSTTNQVRESEDVPSSQPAAQLYSGVAGVMPSETIESLLTEIKAKREEHDAIAAKADALALEIASIEQQVNDKLKEYGFALSHVAAPSEPVQYEITDWRDLRIGDVIMCVTQGIYGYRLERLNWVVGEECQVIKLEEPGHAGQPILAKFKNGEEWWIGEFKFIRRP